MGRDRSQRNDQFVRCFKIRDLTQCGLIVPSAQGHRAFAEQRADHDTRGRVRSPPTAADVSLCEVCSELR